MMQDDGSQRIIVETIDTTVQCEQLTSRNVTIENIRRVSRTYVSNMTQKVIRFYKFSLIHVTGNRIMYNISVLLIKGN